MIFQVVGKVDESFQTELIGAFKLLFMDWKFEGTSGLHLG
jgi:hypothetical protein